MAACELRLLGSTDLTGVTDPGNVLAHPKRLALLTYLALERPGAFHRRDALLAMLWPEADTERGRNSLRQAIHQLRRTLGAETVVSRGEGEIALGAGALWCDAAECERRFTAGDFDGALALYRGDLLPAFFVSGSHEFEDWLERRRAELRDRAARAAWRISDLAEERGDLADAARLAVRALAFDPEDAAGRQRVERLRKLAGAAPAVPRSAESIVAVTGAAPAHAAPRSRAHIVAVAALVVVAAATAVLLGRSRKAALDERLLIVAPFRTTGADSGLGFLHDGMTDLVALALSGEGGLHAADPRVVAAALQTVDPSTDEIRRVAERLGAGQVLVGSVVGRPARLILSTQLVDTRSGRAQSLATIEGPLDSLSHIIDRLTLQLLATDAREPRTRIASLTSTSLPALRAYLLGRGAFRSGRYVDAAEHLSEAVALDSTFAVAALELVRAADWLPSASDTGMAGLAWRGRHRLPAPDRAILVALVGPRYPAPPTFGERFAGWEEAARLAPGQPDVWYGLGDTFLHLGAVTGADTGFTHAEAAFARAVSLDSTFTAPLEHLVQIALLRRDRPAVRRLAALHAARDSTGDAAVYLRWRVAVELGDSAVARGIELSFDTVSIGVLTRIVEWSQLDGVGVPAAARASAVLLRRAGGGERYARRLVATLATNRGRFADYDTQLAAMGLTADGLRAHRVYAVLHLDGDSASGRAALRFARTIAALADCGVAVWGMLGPQPADAAALQEHLDACRHDRASSYRLAAAALHAAMTRSPDLPAVIASLRDTALAAAGQGSANSYSLMEGEAWMIAGEFAKARDAFRRRELGGAEAALGWASMLRREGRAAELAGDTAGAVRAYRHYLALRYDPDPSVRFFADSARAALARLEQTR